MSNMHGTKVVYGCYQWDPHQGEEREFLGVCLSTSDIEVLKKHYDEVIANPSAARNHMLDISTFNREGRSLKFFNLESMCLADVIIDVEGNMVRHVLEQQPNRKEMQG